MDGYLNVTQLNPAMYHQSKFLLIIATILTISCNNPSEKEERNTKVKEVFVDEDQLRQTIFNIIDSESYEEIFKKANDSLSFWCKHNLPSVKELNVMGYKLDSILCFNQKKDKFIGAILIPCTMPDCKQVDIRYLYGVEISSQWYFFFGPTIVLPQARPATFFELHRSALKEAFRGYLKKSSTGKWEINEQFFNDLTRGGFVTNAKLRRISKIEEIKKAIRSGKSIPATDNIIARQISKGALRVERRATQTAVLF